MRILHTVAGLWTTTGGPAASVPGLCRALAERGHEITLLTGEGALAREVRAAAGEITLRTARLGPYAAANLSPAFRRACRREAASCEIVHNHGVWLDPNWSSAAAARAAGRPLVISPRGMLEPWSLARSRWRKRLLWALVERRSFAGAALIHATSAAEAASVRRLGVATPIAVVPNGVDLDGEYESGRIDSLRRPPGAGDRDPATVLFLSRIHPKKGLDLLLAAWGEIGDRAARLVLCGGGEPAHVGWLEARLEAAGDERVEYLGPVSGARKLELLARARVLVLPSRSENYGMVVAEALACGTPVVTTTATPWREIAERGCGWWVEPDRGAIRDALAAALALSEDERTERGRRGRELIEREHSLARAAEMMEAAYAWTLGAAGGDKPAWVDDRDAA